MNHDQNLLYNLMKMPIGSPDNARRFLAYIAPHTELHSVMNVAKKIHAANNIVSLKGTELLKGQRSLQDSICDLEGVITFKRAKAELPDENDNSMRVCISRLTANGVLEKLEYGAYWNKRGERPTTRDVIEAKLGSTPIDKLEGHTVESLIERLKTKLPARTFRQVMEAL